VPEELEQRGLTQATWLAWVEELAAVQRKAPDCCVDVWCCILTSGISLCTCRTVASRRAYWDGLTEWQNRFNRQELERLGIFCKTQSHSVMVHTGDGKQQRVTTAWIAFALNPDTVAALRQEPHNTGAVGPCCGCECGAEEAASPMVLS